MTNQQNTPDQQLQEVIPNRVITQILKVRDFIATGDSDEAFHQLYLIADPNFEKFFPWEAMEKKVGYELTLQPQARRYTLDELERLMQHYTDYCWETNRNPTPAHSVVWIRSQEASGKVQELLNQNV